MFTLTFCPFWENPTLERFPIWSNVNPLKSVYPILESIMIWYIPICRDGKSYMLICQIVWFPFLEKSSLPYNFVVQGVQQLFILEDKFNNVSLSSIQQLFILPNRSVSFLHPDYIIRPLAVETTFFVEIILSDYLTITTKASFT